MAKKKQSSYPKENLITESWLLNELTSYEAEIINLLEPPRNHIDSKDPYDKAKSQRLLAMRSIHLKARFPNGRVFWAQAGTVCNSTPKDSVEEFESIEVAYMEEGEPKPLKKLIDVGLGEKKKSLIKNCNKKNLEAMLMIIASLKKKKKKEKW